MHKFLLSFALVYTGLITWLSLARVFVPLDIEVKGSDKIGHLLAYFVFTLVWFLWLFFSEKLHKKFSTSIKRASVFAFFFGVLMEMLQALLTSYRSPEWYDVLANTSGIIFAVIFLKVFENKLINKRDLLI